ncbi:MAG: hypothetical protein GQ561_06455 [Calditrichae bacterium]|nr:hypothetical protein [Calditrichia bacterium]
MVIRFLTLLLLFSFLGLEAISQKSQSPKQSQTSDETLGFPWAHDSRPYVEGSYGLTLPRHKKYEGEFTRLGTGELRLGYSKILPFKKLLVDMDELYIFGGIYSKELDKIGDQEQTAKTNLEMIRFGVGNRLGYGYRLWILGVMLFNEVQGELTRVESERLPDITKNDSDILDRYEGSYRLGISTAGGVNVQLFKSLSAVVSYEAAVIYPRVVFFPWLGGLIVQTIIVGSVSRFAEDIVGSSPALGPIMYAVLRNAVSYGVYLGMREYQYWPIKSETPLTHETLKLGFSITF